MTYTIQMTGGNATGHNEPSLSNNIPHHGASSFSSSSHPSTSTSLPEHSSYETSFSPSSSGQSLSSATTLTQPSIMPINTSLQPNHRIQPASDIEQFSHSRSPIVPRRRAYSASMHVPEAGPDSHLVYAPTHSFTTDPISEVPLSNDIPEQMQSQFRSYSYSDSVNSESPSEDREGSVAVNHDATHNGGAHRTKRRRASRTQETLITEKCARDRLALAFNMLRDALPDHLKTLRCGRANFLAETSEWVQSIQVANEQLKADNQALRNMLQNCSCGAMQRQNTNYLHASAAPYYNPGSTYV